MLSNGSLLCTYDSANKLLSAGGHTYSYNAENVRIRNLCEDEDTTYTYNTNCKLSQLLVKVTGSVTTKYVYGKGLIGEESNGKFKTYHFDSRGSTIAITDENGNITDTFAYDTYGKQIARTGTSTIIFGYNGMYGVITDKNGLVYMRARYYSPEMRRFINADIVAGKITNATTLNRYAYANGNPVSMIDPFGLAACPFGPCQNCMSKDDYIRYLAGEISAPSSGSNTNKNKKNNSQLFNDNIPTIAPNPKKPNSKTEPASSSNQSHTSDDYEAYFIAKINEKTEYEIANSTMTVAGYAKDIFLPISEELLTRAIRNSPRPNNIGIGTWTKQVDADIASLNKGFKYAGYGLTVAFTILNTGIGIEENIKNGESTGEIISDAAIDIGAGVFSITIILAEFGTAISPGVGTAIGIGVGLIYDLILNPLLDYVFEF